jgi:hydroxymethylglutaryl-CoA lyase
MTTGTQPPMAPARQPRPVQLSWAPSGHARRLLTLALAGLLIAVTTRRAEFAAAAGPVEVAVADTIGVASPGEVTTLVARVAAAIKPLPVRVHFHNTRNTGLANVWAAVQAGAKIVDASLGGIGGCPFAPRATGNVPTEDVVYMLQRSGYQTGLDVDRLIISARWLAGAMGRDVPGMLSRAGAFPKKLPEAIL